MAAKYEQLASILRSEVQQILRQGGSKLATEAELSQRYHMSRQTVRHALKLLEEENLIERRQGSGSYIRQSGRSDDVHQIAVITTFLDDYIFPSILPLPRPATAPWYSPRRTRSAGSGKSF